MAKISINQSINQYQHRQSTGGRHLSIFQSTVLTITIVVAVVVVGGSLGIIIIEVDGDVPAALTERQTGSIAYYETIYCLVVVVVVPQPHPTWHILVEPSQEPLFHDDGGGGGGNPLFSMSVAVLVLAFSRLMTLMTTITSHTVHKPTSEPIIMALTSRSALMDTIRTPLMLAGMRSTGVGAGHGGSWARDTLMDVAARLEGTELMGNRWT